jgi:selenide, water dikinase
MTNNTEEVKLTQYSHGAGCGCKIAPQVLDIILKGNIAMPNNQNLLVGNHSKDDAAVLDLGTGQALISTTDFFMPIVDNPYHFGRIAACNAISDVYAMGGKPILAIAILGWPIAKLSPQIAQQVVDGARSVCIEAGITLAGGHSIDSPEPIFGLAVNGMVATSNIKKNNTAKLGDLLFLTKPLGVGILTTAEKQGKLLPEHQNLAAQLMMRLNTVGQQLGQVAAVTAMTDVTGFGLLGHMVEMAEGSGLSAQLYAQNIQYITTHIEHYIAAGAVPGGTNRNWASYGHKIGPISDSQKALLADPQTSGGLLIAVPQSQAGEVVAVLESAGLQQFTSPIGRLSAATEQVVYL